MPFIKLCLDSDKISGSIPALLIIVLIDRNNV